VVRSIRCCLNIDFVNVAVDSIIFKVDSGLGILILREVDESLHRNDYTGGEVRCRVSNTFIDQPKDEQQITRIQKRIMEVIIQVEARICAEDRGFPFILLWNKNLRSRGSPRRTSRGIQVHTGRGIASSCWNGTAGSCRALRGAARSPNGIVKEWPQQLFLLY